MDYFINNLRLDIRLLLSIAIIIVTILAFFLMRSEYIFLLGKKIKKKTDCKITNILSKETYKKTKKFFDLHLEIPVMIIIITILFLAHLIFPFNIPFEVMFILFLAVMILYLAFFPQIFEAIEKKNLVKLDQYLINQKEDSLAIIEMFSYVWEIKDDDIEKNFSVSPTVIFTIFSQKIDNLFKKQKITTLLIYFNHFLDFIDNRSKITLTDKEIYSKFLEWHFIAWKKRYEHSLSIDNLNFREQSGELFITIEFIIQKKVNHFLIGEKSLLLFKTFKEHLYKHKKDFFVFTNQKISYYSESLFSNFLKELFATVPNLPIQKRETIWRYYFSNEWKVTIANLKDSNNLLVNISFNYFLDWAQERILENKKINIDKELDTISTYLFPEIDSITWDRILIFILSPYDGKSKVRSAIERIWNFGFAKETHLDYYEGEKEADFIEARNIRIDKTIELAFFLFKDHFTDDKLRLYITDLERLKYKDFSPEENKRYQLLTIFYRMINSSYQAKKLLIEVKTPSLDGRSLKNKIITSFEKIKRLVSPDGRSVLPSVDNYHTLSSPASRHKLPSPASRPKLPNSMNAKKISHQVKNKHLHKNKITGDEIDL